MKPVEKFGVVFWKCFESLRLYVFDQKYSKNNNTIKYYYIENQLYGNIF